MDHGEGEADGDAGDRCVGDLIGRAQHHEHQHGREQDLDDDHRADTVAVLEHTAERAVHRRGAVRAPAVRPEPVGGTVVARKRRRHRVERQTGDQTADDLRDPVTHGAHRGHMTDDELPERHRRVHVTPGDRADGVHEEQQGQAERQCDAELADIGSGEHRGTHRGEHQEEGSDRLRYVFPQIGELTGVSDFQGCLACEIFVDSGLGIAWGFHGSPRCSRSRTQAEPGGRTLRVDAPQPRTRRSRCEGDYASAVTSTTTSCAVACPPM